MIFDSYSAVHLRFLYLNYPITTTLLHW